MARRTARAAAQLKPKTKAKTTSPAESAEDNESTGPSAVAEGRGPGQMHELFSAWLKEETGEDIDPNHIFLVTSKRTAFRKSDEYLDYQEQRSAEEKPLKSAKVKAKSRTARTAEEDEDEEEEPQPVRGRRGRRVVAKPVAEPEVDEESDDAEVDEEEPEETEEQVVTPIRSRSRRARPGASAPETEKPSSPAPARTARRRGSRATF